MHRIQVNDNVKLYIRGLSDKDRRIVGEYIERLKEHPNAPGNIKKMKTRKPRWRLHIGSKYTLFYFTEGEMVCIDEMMTQEQAHKRYGKFVK
jgi:mRNA-degrading endonuclease RelE of RelBE toxin-antitoxin system